ncbi:hypothetical protein AMECASPLE_023571 [Ameca splendens]|uniref:Secreted protein n=1 Tax=Ameca splendens TaxID=208324 RepID=A0ABV0YFS8_9TELE
MLRVFQILRLIFVCPPSQVAFKPVSSTIPDFWIKTFWIKTQASSYFLWTNFKLAASWLLDQPAPVKANPVHPPTYSRANISTLCSTPPSYTPWIVLDQTL